MVVVWWCLRISVNNIRLIVFFFAFLHLFYCHQMNRICHYYSEEGALSLSAIYSSHVYSRLYILEQVV